MTTYSIDAIAWDSAWRTRAVSNKALLCGGLMLVALFSSGWVTSALVLATVVGIAFLWAAVPVREYLVILSAPWSFIVLGAAMMALSLHHPGQAELVQVGPLAINHDGALRAVDVAVRSFAGAAALILFALTTPMTQLLTWLTRLGIPAALVDIAGLTYRLVFQVMDGAATILATQRARLGFVTARTARRSLGLLFATVITNSWNRARRLDEGMAGRGFTGELRTLAPVSRTDWRFVSVTTLTLMALITVEVWLR